MANPRKYETPHISIHHGKYLLTITHMIHEPFTSSQHLLHSPRAKPLYGPQTLNQRPVVVGDHYSKNTPGSTILQLASYSLTWEVHWEVHWDGSFSNHSLTQNSNQLYHACKLLYQHRLASMNHGTIATPPRFTTVGHSTNFTTDHY